MTNAIKFFKEVYGEVPNWAQKMNDYTPDAFEAYTQLRKVVMQDGALSRKDKECILVGINAARRYERSMIYHTQGAVDAGTSLEELAEILSVCVLSRGLPAWLEGIKALAFASNYMHANGKTKDNLVKQPTKAKSEFESISECLNYYRSKFGTEPKWVEDLAKYHPNALIHYTNLRNANLADQGIVPRKLKELVLVGINTSERYPEGVRIHTEGAKACGATENELAECHLTAVLTAGIPAWFEGSDFL
ncbi:carboxymuconolactone decarboxylase family protein [Scopulibacillus cellulosilyticus]|uniref:Carboxymuconolactone decarboxylase family protein n=1 Tax=Scopulibacillus cellulosilyticus TaxID=2665665 RepID=A0ABW2PUH5_9BACL